MTEDYWNPEPPRCPRCASAVELTELDGSLGRCAEHGVVTATYGTREFILRRELYPEPLSDPKHPDHHSVYADVWDMREKF